MGSRGIAAGWRMTSEMYEPQFRDFMNRTMGDLVDQQAGGSRSTERWKAVLKGSA
jgi:hypothetical protein